MLLYHLKDFSFHCKLISWVLTRLAHSFYEYVICWRLSLWTTQTQCMSEHPWQLCLKYTLPDLIGWILVWSRADHILSSNNLQSGQWKGQPLWVMKIWNYRTLLFHEGEREEGEKNEVDALREALVLLRWDSFFALGFITLLYSHILHLQLFKSYSLKTFLELYFSFKAPLRRFTLL